MAKKLSIIILSFNTKELLGSCLESVKNVRDELDFEVIVSDNGSHDGSTALVKHQYPWVKLLENSQNLGFAKGNNQARGVAEGKFILFLNSDTQVTKGTLKESVSYIESDDKIGALTCKIVLPDGKLDKDSRRAFPTPWVALCHFLGLDRLFPKSKLFSKYWYTYIDENKIHEVDVLQGAFFLTRKKILSEVGWFDEDYFLDGEDIDLSWRIKKLGYRIVYYPKVSILHRKKATKKKVKGKFIGQGVNAMAIFYKKHLANEYPFYINIAVFSGINILKIARTIKLFVFK